MWIACAAADESRDVYTAQSTEWMVMNISAGAPSPNHNMASGSSEIAGKGWNIAVMVLRKSLPMRLETAKIRINAAQARPAA